MEQGLTSCPVCTLYLREGISLQAHLETHPKDKVIEALLKVTNNGTGDPATPLQTTPGSVRSEAFVPPQPFVPPNAAFMSQTQNYMNPQTQMTAAVTYQQIVTNNGSPVMPQYIQVPTILAPNTNVPIIPNQSLNYVPNHQNAYAHTMYNPLYNPYIPQPYPIVQPVYTSMPVTSDSNTLGTTSQITNTPTSSNQTSVTKSSETNLKQVSNAATNTKSKNSVAKVKSKKLPIKSTTQTKLKIIKQLGSRTKTTTSTMATVATKSYRITSINSSKTNSTEKTSVITNIKTKNRLLLPRPSSSNSRIISPPPLTLMASSRGNSVSCSTTTSPPPLSKAPCPPSIPSTAFELPSIVKTEKTCTDSEETESKPEMLERESADSDIEECLIDDQHESPPVNSVIVESNSAIQITSNIVLNSLESAENTSHLESESIISRTPALEEVVHTELCESNECENIDGNGDDFENEEDQGSEFNDDQLPEKVFHSFEFEEEKKVAFNFGIRSDETQREISSENVDRNCDDSDIFDGEESIPFISEGPDEDLRSRTERTVEPTDCSIEFQDDNLNNDRKESVSALAANGKVSSLRSQSERMTEPGESRHFADLKSLTYTDLQPATNNKVLQDLGITSSFNLNNYMEVDGIKIFFNNANVRSVPLEPIIKFTSNMKGDMTRVQNYMKTEGEVRENDTLVESVIHLVSGTPQKNDFSGEGFPNTSNHQTDGHMDLRDLSPLTLNIRADESMPARGELSEQESLGAENSTWGLFHSELNTTKSSLVPEVMKNCEAVPVNVLKREENYESTKSFKCALCPEVFSCLKDRRLHRNTVHEKSTTAVARKPKTFVCSHCKEKFTSLRDRRRHVIQNHFFDARKVNGIKQENELREETVLRNGSESIDITNVTIKKEEMESTVKSEIPGESQGTKSVCDVTKCCPRCNLPFASAKKLREHLKEVHGVASRYKCGTCLETFDLELEYNSHLRIHPLECSQCGKMFNRKPNLKLHMRRHLVVKPYACTQCPKSFITRQKLDEHLNGHSGNKPLKCSLCDSTFSRHSNLIQHRNIHHLYGKKKVKDFVCRCGEVFHSKRKLEWHKEVHDAKPKTCPFCSQKFVHSNSVTRHIRRSHIPHYLPDDKKDIENVQCPVCGKIYLRSSLIVHMRVHNGEKPFVCKICNKRFTTKWNLELHNWTHQSRNNMPYKCTTCKSAFFREVDFVAHLNAHRNYRPFTCNVCGQKFIRKYNCLRHQDEHKKEKKFVCTVSGCEKSFHRSYYLRDHMRVHTGVRPHTCHICGKASSTKSNHNKHVRIHDTREPLNTEN